MYSTTDGQIYHDDAMTGPGARSADLTAAMATAWLDQEFGWAIGQRERTLDGAALTSAEVLAQATAIQASERVQHGDRRSRPTGPLAYLPAVISYEALAPAMYAPLLAAGRRRRAANPLADLRDTVGPGRARRRRARAGRRRHVVPDGDVIVGSPPAAMDRSFWYLVFAGYLDAPTAYAASESIVESALTVADRAGTTCAYAHVLRRRPDPDRRRCVRRSNRGWRPCRPR